jgi:UDP-3-O-[3-hydroxymyristoyl] glucosamine N-acyltransferase
MGVTINLGVKIGRGVRIGNSAVVKADVPDGAIIRAGAIWPPCVLIISRKNYEN